MRCVSHFSETDNVLTDNDELQDLDCSAARLEFSAEGGLVSHSQTGRDIHCENGGVMEEDHGDRAVTTFIPSENDCLMTFDDYSVLLFYTDFDREAACGGRKRFFKIYGVTMDPVKIVNAECWG